MTPHPFRPDHNGECLDCDEPADAHVIVRTATDAEQRAALERDYCPDFWSVDLWRFEGRTFDRRALASYRIAGFDFGRAAHLHDRLRDRIIDAEAEHRIVVSLTPGFVQP